MEIQPPARGEVLLLFVRLDLTDPVNSEVCFRQALKVVEDNHGEESPEAGLCLVELSDLLEFQGQQTEADFLSKRYKGILCTLARKLGLSG